MATPCAPFVASSRVTVAHTLRNMTNLAALFLFTGALLLGLIRPFERAPRTVGTG